LGKQDTFVYNDIIVIMFLLSKIVLLPALMSEVGRAMAQAVIRRPLTVEAQVRLRVSPCRICDGQSGTGTGFSPSNSVFPYQVHSTGAPLLGKI
jgi:hypothetical protein